MPPEELERIARPRRVKGGCSGDRRWVAVRGRTRRTYMDTAVKDGKIWFKARLSSQFVSGGGLPKRIFLTFPVKSSIYYKVIPFHCIAGALKRV